MVACVLIPLLGMLSGCGGQRPFLMVQICLGDDQNVVLFENTLMVIAQSQNMTYIDGSKDTQKKLVQMDVSPNFRVIDIAVDGKDGVGMGAGNQSLSAHEVAVGFSEGSNPAGAQQFAQLVVERLQQRWPVSTVPQGRGAFPMKGCARGISNREE